MTSQRNCNLLFDRRLFILDNAKFKQFMDVLDAPPTTNEKLHKLLTTKAPWDEA